MIWKKRDQHIYNTRAQVNKKTKKKEHKSDDISGCFSVTISKILEVVSCVQFETLRRRRRLLDILDVSLCEMVRSENVDRML